MTTARIVLHGCSGSGKSTLAARLHEALGLPVIELDALFHRADWQPAPEDEFRTLVTAALDDAEDSAGGWIVDGNYDSTLGGLVRDRANIVIWFDLPRRVVMRRVVGRTLRRAVRREELWNGNRERWSSMLRWDPEESIIRWAWTRHATYRRRLTAAADAAGVHQRWIRIGSNADAEEAIRSLVATSRRLRPRPAADA